MKTTFAVIVSFIFLAFGWLFLAGLLYGLGYLAAQSRGGMDLPHLLNMLLMWVLAPGFGGFLASFITPKIFKTISPSTITTSFMSIILTLGILLGIFSFFIVQGEHSSFGELIIFSAQISAIIIGAKIGKSVCISESA